MGRNPGHVRWLSGVPRWQVVAVNPHEYIPELAMSANGSPELRLSTLPPERMRCLEIWGGNRATDKQLEMPGLCVWVYSRPHGHLIAA